MSRSDIKKIEMKKLAQKKASHIKDPVQNVRVLLYLF